MIRDITLLLWTAYCTIMLAAGLIQDPSWTNGLVYLMVWGFMVAIPAILAGEDR